MNRRTILALGGALTIAAAVTASGAAAASGPSVSVRIEGKNKTLLTATKVTPHSGTVKVSGKTCPADTGAGAVALAVHGAWSGKWFSFGLQVEKILGETDIFGKPNDWWELFVNNVAASSGICDVKLKRGEQILFAAVPDKGTVFPLSVSAPAHAAKGHAFTVTVKAFNGKGKAAPLAGAKVDGQSTDSAGHATITLAHSGHATVTATAKGFVRAEAQVRVS
jgi:hypothetical protein